MKFLNPAGLWLLSAIPVLILIYIIKSKHEDLAVSSSYIWQLSSRFRKKRIPVNRFRKILLFVLQILMLISAAFLVSRPVWIEGECIDYILVLDTSASMSIIDHNGVSRLDKAVKQAKTLSEQSRYGHRFSVVTASDSTGILLEKATDESEIQNALLKVKATYGSADLGESFSVVDEIAKTVQNPKVVFYTDRPVNEPANVTVVDLSSDEWNVTLENASYEIKTEEKRIDLKVDAVSYGGNTNLTVGLRVDGNTVDAIKTVCQKDQVNEICFTYPGTTFDSAEFFIQNEDGLEVDNRYAICRDSDRPCNVLIVSDNKLYLKSMFSSFERCNVKTQSTAEEISVGYDLYIFDCFTPAKYPTDGSLILIQPQGLPAGVKYGLGIREEGDITLNRDLSVRDFDDCTFHGTVANDTKSLVANQTWESILSCDGYTVAVGKKHLGGLSTVVTSFNLHDTNLAMQRDFADFTNALLSYTVPNLVDKNEYAFGEAVQISTLPGSESCYLKTPDGKMQPISMQSGMTLYLPETTGIYTAVQLQSDGSGIYKDFFVHLKDGETDATPIEALPSVSEGNPETESAGDAMLELTFWFAVALLVLLLAEWGVYSYEQY